MAVYKNIKYVTMPEAVEHTDGVSALADVDTVTSAPNDGNILSWSASASKWVPAAPASGSTLPVFTSVSPSSGITDTTLDLTITGNNFTSLTQVELVDTSTGIYYIPNSITFNNSTSLVVNFTPTTNANYKIRIENTDGGAVISATSPFTTSTAPTFSTSNGSIGSMNIGESGNFSVTATSDSAVTYAVTSGALPTGLSLNTSTGAITGTETAGTPTTYNFTITATDAESQTVDGVFSINVTAGATGGGQFN